MYILHLYIFFLNTLSTFYDHSRTCKLSHRHRQWRGTNFSPFFFFFFPFFLRYTFVLHNFSINWRVARLGFTKLPTNESSSGETTVLQSPRASIGTFCSIENTVGSRCENIRTKERKTRKIIISDRENRSPRNDISTSIF